MQGRLLPKFKGLYQAHPKGYWQDEFEIARGIGLNGIEFILDYDDANSNPLLSNDGINNIIEISNQNNISVKTICADYFMEAPLHSNNFDKNIKSQNILIKLINNAQKLAVTDIVIPCVDKSSLDSKSKVDIFVKNLSPVIEVAEEKSINLSLETDLSPKSFTNLLKRFDSSRVTVNYDIGNSASLGFDIAEELDAYGHRITDIHIKDRILNGGPILLGQGNADFERFFHKLREFNYNGPFIMQAYRDDEGLEIFKKQLLWIKEVITSFYEN